MNEFWSTGTLSDLALINPDKASAIRGLKKFRYIDISCLSESGIADSESIPVISADVAPSRAQRLLQTGDSLVGTVRPERGARGLVGKDLHGEVASSGICVLRPKLANDSVFVYAVIRDPSFTEWCVNHSTGTSYPAVAPSDIERFPLLLPSSSERQRIAQVIGALDDRIEVLRRLQGLLQDEARALLALALVDGAVEVKLGDIADVVMGNSPPGSSYNTDGMGTPLFQGCAEFGFRYPLERLYTTQPSRMAAADDTLVSVRAPVGKLNRASGACCIGRGVAAVRSDAYPSLVYYALDASNDVWDPYNSEGTVFGSINGGSLRGLKVTWPANPDVLERQLRGIDEAINRFALEGKELISSRAALLPALVSGELRVAAAKEMVETKS